MAPKLLIACLVLASCQTPTKSEVDALIWNTNFPIPQELCLNGVRQYGFYRRLDDGRLEFWSGCNVEMPPMVCMKAEEYKALLDQYIKKP